MFLDSSVAKRSVTLAIPDFSWNANLPRQDCSSRSGISDPLVLGVDSIHSFQPSFLSKTDRRFRWADWKE